jgi:transposase
MEVMVERCCGLDVHQASVVACLLVAPMGGKPRREVRTFGTVRRDLEALRDWLTSEGCTHAAMESTGVYWMPVYAVLEGHVQIIVGNAAHIRNVPGRKTDVKDSEWLADLCRHGLIRPSFVPPPALRELRDVLRYRRKLVETQASERNRLQRLLETANIKLASVMSDVVGVSGRLMLRALLDGHHDPAEIAKLARGRLRKKVALLALALDGALKEHHRLLLRLQLDRIESHERDIGELDSWIKTKLEPYRRQYERLMEIPGVDQITAATVIAELGVDMSVFPTVHHAAAWAGVSPGNHESAGRTKGQRKRHGNVHLTTALVQAAMAARRKRGSYFRAKYWRLHARRGPKRAAIAVAHRILVAAYQVLARDVAYRDLGEDYVDRHAAKTLRRNLVRRLERLGYQVSLTPIEQPAAAG